MQTVPMVELVKIGEPRPLPSVLYIEPTNRCNSLCTECPRTFGINTEAPRDLTLSCCFVPFTGRPYANAVLGNALHAGLDAVWNGTGYRAFGARFESARPPQRCAGCGSEWGV